MAAAPFSRLHLAAALIEYDNDNSDSESSKRSAHQSAIFAHLRRKTPAHLSQQLAPRRSTDYLAVSLPNEAATRESLIANRRSQASFNDLHNPFGRDSTVEGYVEDEEEELEVDLSSWGLDAFEDKEKGSKKKKKARLSGVGEEDALPNPHPPLREAVGRKTVTSGARTLSVGNIDQMGLGGAFLDAKSTVQSTRPALGGRRASMGSPLDYADIQPVDPVLQRGRQPSEHALIDGIPITPPLHAVPFPSALSVRSNSPAAQLNDPGSHAPRPSSRASAFALDQTDTQDANPFTVRPPSPDRASRFDPKAQAAQMRARTVSNGTLGTQQLLNDEDFNNDYAPSVLSGVPTEAGRTRPYSRLELMRPKVLIMPPPLQPSAPTAASGPSKVASGFELSIDGRPLPPGARTVNTRRASVSARSMFDLQQEMLGVSLTPDPRTNLTLSQMTFRDSLAPNAIGTEGLRRAHEDGEKIELEPEVEEVQPATELSEQKQGMATEEKPRSRAPGKLFGKSLIDDLEARKAEMKGKQRVFRGDERPSMMARTPLQRQSTLIDPESLKVRPQSQRLDTYQSAPELSRRHSANLKTLISLDDEIPGAPRNTTGARLGAGLGVGMPGGNPKSVFGVDTIWERELAKLREIEAKEREEEEARNAQEGSGKKKRKKGKDKDKRADESPQVSTPSQVVTPQTQTSLSPGPTSPGLSPNAQRTTFFQRHPAPPPNLTAGDSDEESDDSDDSSPPVGARQSRIPNVEGWNSDEEQKSKSMSVTSPRQTVGSGPRMANLPPRLRALQESGELHIDPDDLVTQEDGEDPNSHHGHGHVGDDDSEEDLPLAATIGRAAERATRREFGGRPSLDDDESDEDKPLAQVLDKTKSALATGHTTSSGPLSFGFGEGLFDGGLLGTGAGTSVSGVAGLAKVTGGKSGDEDEDDKPLGLRVSRAFPTLPSGDDEDEDDKPLALRKSQFIANPQHPQQQMMMQQQMMYGNPNAAMSMSGMGAPFFPGPLMPQATGMSMGMGMGMMPNMGPMMGMGGPMMGMGPMGMGMGMGPMVPAVLPSTPPPMQDTAKLNRVDKWRHDVAVEGER